MVSFTVSALVGLLAAAASAAPFSIPTADGFPFPNADQLKAIQQAADGTIPNGPPPPTLSADGITNFRLLAVGESFEVAFFTSLLHNLTHNVEGFRDVPRKEALIEIIETIKNQEELHAINVNNALTKFTGEPIQPCTYKFPTTDLKGAINLASDFTELVLGTLQDVQFVFANNNDNGAVRAVGSVIGQEGEQEGFYRTFLGRKPTPHPFLTTSVRDFSFTVLQDFIVECPQDLKALIPLKTFGKLNLLSVPEAKDQELSYSIDLKQIPNWEQYKTGEGLFITYINQQNVPISQQLTNVQLVDHSILTFEAFFPFEATIMKGMTIAALTTGNKFASAGDVSAATLFGPALIFINDLLPGSTGW